MLQHEAAAAAATLQAVVGTCLLSALQLPVQQLADASPTLQSVTQQYLTEMALDIIPGSTHAVYGELLVLRSSQRQWPDAACPRQLSCFMRPLGT